MVGVYPSFKPTNYDCFQILLAHCRPNQHSFPINLMSLFPAMESAFKHVSLCCKKFTLKKKGILFF